MFYNPYFCRVRIILYGLVFGYYLILEKSNKNRYKSTSTTLQISKNEVDQRQIQSRRKPLEPSSLYHSTRKGSQRNNATFTWHQSSKEREAFWWIIGTWSTPQISSSNHHFLRDVLVFRGIWGFISLCWWVEVIGYSEAWHQATLHAEWSKTHPSTPIHYLYPSLVQPPHSYPFLSVKLGFPP